MPKPTPTKMVAAALANEKHARAASAALARAAPLPKALDYPVEHWPTEKRDAQLWGTKVRNAFVDALVERFLAMPKAYPGAAWTLPPRTLDGSVRSLAAIDEHWHRRAPRNYLKPTALLDELAVALGAYAFRVLANADGEHPVFELANDVTDTRIAASSSWYVAPWTYVELVLTGGFALTALEERVSAIVHRDDE